MADQFCDKCNDLLPKDWKPEDRCRNCQRNEYFRRRTNILLEKKCSGCEVVRELHSSGECFWCLRAAGLKVCTKCKVPKLAELNFQKGQLVCRDCRSPLWRLTPAQRAMHMTLMRMYNLTYAEYVKMYEAQHGRCPICWTKLPRLSVDHDHKTLLIRGLLCPKCNSGLGMFDDDPARLGRAAEYLTASAPGSPAPAAPLAVVPSAPPAASP